MKIGNTTRKILRQQINKKIHNAILNSIIEKVLLPLRVISKAFLNPIVNNAKSIVKIWK
jgi:hypothetical protein